MIDRNRDWRTSLEIFDNSWREDLQLTSQHLYWRPHSGLLCLSRLSVKSKSERSLTISLTIITIN